MPPVAEGERFMLGDAEFIVSGGIPRAVSLYSPAQSQTEETFGFKWKKRDTFDSPGSLKRIRDWLTEKYGNVVEEDWFASLGEHPLVLDAGCGAGVSALEVFGAAGKRIRYLGVDISTAVDVAHARFQEKGLAAGFIQADISKLPFPDSSVDLIFSEGVLHHTDSTERAFKALTPLIKPGGYFMFYVYRRKGPIREFTDDYVRDRLQSMSPEEAWLAMEPLTQLGISLGRENLEIDIPKPIDLLGIPAGRINIQRLFYWHVAKAFYHPDLSFDEMNHINYDWYAPANAHRHSLEEVSGWCQDAGMVVMHEVVEEAGITIIARKTS
jgi:SAM-dependent methyltransferase